MGVEVHQAGAVQFLVPEQRRRMADEAVFRTQIGADAVTTIAMRQLLPAEGDAAVGGGEDDTYVIAIRQALKAGISSLLVGLLYIMTKASRILTITARLSLLGYEGRPGPTS